MATKKITELSQANTVANNDLLVIVSNPDSSSETKKVTVGRLFNNTAGLVITANTITTNSFVVSNTATIKTLTANSITAVDALINQNKQTPANSTITISQGRIFYDNNYLYIATSSNQLKRVALESF